MTTVVKPQTESEKPMQIRLQLGTTFYVRDPLRRVCFAVRGLLRLTNCLVVLLNFTRYNLHGENRSKVIDVRYPHQTLG